MKREKYSPVRGFRFSPQIWERFEGICASYGIRPISALESLMEQAINVNQLELDNPKFGVGTNKILSEINREMTRLKNYHREKG